MDQRVGSCSICGGDVVGFRGVWGAVIPPPPDSCTSCGAKNSNDVIQMGSPSNKLYSNSSLIGHMADSITISKELFTKYESNNELLEKIKNLGIVITQNNDKSITFHFKNGISTTVYPD